MCLLPSRGKLSSIILFPPIDMVLICLFFISKFLGCQAKLVLKGLWELQSRERYIKVSLFKHKNSIKMLTRFPQGGGVYCLHFFFFNNTITFLQIEVRYNLQHLLLKKMLGEKNILLQMLYMPLSFLCNFKNSFNFPPVSKESSNVNDGHGFFFNF